MTPDLDDIVKVYSGPLVEVEAYQQVLKESGIESRVVGTNLTASFGSALSDSIELWVHRGDAEKAVAAIQLDQESRGKDGAGGDHPHPTDEGRPGPAPHRKEPHVKQDRLGQ